MIKVEGEKGTFANSTMEAFFNKDDQLEIKKGCITLVLSNLQAEELMKMIKRKLNKIIGEKNERGL